MTREAKSPFALSVDVGCVFDIPVVADYMNVGDLNDDEIFMHKARAVCEWYDEIMARREERMIAIKKDVQLFGYRFAFFNPLANEWTNFQDMEWGLESRRYWVDMT